MNDSFSKNDKIISLAVKAGVRGLRADNDDRRVREDDVETILQICAATLEYKLNRVQKILAMSKEERARHSYCRPAKLLEMVGDLLDESSLAFSLLDEKTNQAEADV